MMKAAVLPERYMYIFLKGQKVQSLRKKLSYFSNFSVFAFELKSPGQTAYIFNQVQPY